MQTNTLKVHFNILDIRTRKDSVLLYEKVRSGRKNVEGGERYATGVSNTVAVSEVHLPTHNG